jgi:hypothetical protein
MNLRPPPPSRRGRCQIRGLCPCTSPCGKARGITLAPPLLNAGAPAPVPPKTVADLARMAGEAAGLDVVKARAHSCTRH